ncbi:MAG: PIN domain-containing protein [Acidobacteria bacterium]|nr:PIN domain-containing protein [Acidobacteriota bacterium]
MVDINVILDVLLDRQPHAEASARVWAAIETGKVAGALAAHAITTIHYLVRRERGASVARRAVTALPKVFRIVAVGEEVIRAALLLPGLDFEDNVTAAAAHMAGCDAIVTRDPKGYPNSPVPAITPEAAAEWLSA